MSLASFEQSPLNLKPAFWLALYLSSPEYIDFHSPVWSWSGSCFLHSHHTQRDGILLRRRSSTRAGCIQCSGPQTWVQGTDQRLGLHLMEAALISQFQRECKCIQTNILMKLMFQKCIKSIKLWIIKNI